MRSHYIPISGKDSLAAAIIQKAKDPTIDYKYIYNDTGAELPEVSNWLDLVESELSIKIERIGSNLTDIISDIGILPSPKKRYCTIKSKIEPMEDYIKKPAVIYYGLRYDEQDRIGYVTSDRNIKAIYPLREAGINKLGVYSILGKMGLLPPMFFWEDIYNRVKGKIGGDFAAVDNLPVWIKAPLFSWRSRPNCYYCFYQRQYEIVGLYEHHPDLFYKAVDMERKIGGDGYTWIKEGSLMSFVDRAEQIKNRRVNQIVNELIFKIRALSDELIPSSGRYIQYVDDLDVRSCGLLCGK